MFEHRLAGRILGGALSLAVAMGALAASPPLTAASGLTYITSCNPTYTISSPGAYLVANDLTAAPGTDCIDINASNVVLDLEGHTLTGPLKTGFGILTKEGHTGIRIVNGTVSDFLYGIFNKADGTIIEGVTAEGNGQFGIGEQSINGGVIANDVVSGNGLDGIDAYASSNLRIANTTADNNGYDGIAVLGNASSNTVAGNVAHGNGQYGIDVSQGSTHNRIAGNTSTTNLQYDLFDGATACDSDLWAGDSFGTRNQSCVH